MPETTDALIKQIQEAEYPEEALGQLRPGQQVRVIFAMYMGQIATAMEANASIGINLSVMLEDHLEQTIDRMFRPYIEKIHREANLDFREAQTMITRLRARAARFEAALRAMVYEATHLSPRNDDGSHDCKISAEALSAARAALEGKP